MASVVHEEYQQKARKESNVESSLQHSVKIFQLMREKKKVGKKSLVIIPAKKLQVFLLV